MNKYNNNNITDNLTAHSIANEINMSKRKSLLHIIVEGYSDKIVYEKYFDKTRVYIVPTNNKNRSIKIKRESLIITEISYVVIVDSDYDEILNKKVSDILYTDTTCLETMMLFSYKFPIQIQDPEILQNQKIIERYLDYSICVSKIIGKIRLLNEKHSLNIDFKNIDYKSLIFDKVKDDHTFFELIILELKNNAKNIHVDFDNLKSRISEIDNYDFEKICNGHDLLKIIYIQLFEVCDQQNKKLFSERFYKTYTKARFKQSLLYKALENWEKNNNFKFLIKDEDF